MAGVLESYLAGREARRVEAENQRANAMREYMSANGQAIMNGDQSALGVVAGYDLETAMRLQGMQEDRTRAAAADARAVTADNRANQTFQHQVEAWAADKTAAEKAEVAAKLEASVKTGLALPDAPTWDAYMTKNAPNLVGQFDQREAIATQYMDIADVLKMGEAPEPLSPEGKLEADRRAGLVGPGVSTGDPKAEGDFRKEFAGLTPVKDFADQTQAFATLQATAQRANAQPSAASDIALVFTFMKTLDPASTVREGEFAAAAKAGSFGDQIAALVSRVESGELLTEQMRKDFVKTAGKLFIEGKGQYRGLRDDYEERAIKQGLAPDMAMQDVASPVPLTSPRPQRMPGAPAVVDVATPNAPDGVDPALWPDLFNAMTPEQRKLFQ
jgi:hypothetical protein